MSHSPKRIFQTYSRLKSIAPYRTGVCRISSLQNAMKTTVSKLDTQLLDEDFTFSDDSSPQSAQKMREDVRVDDINFSSAFSDEDVLRNVTNLPNNTGSQKIATQCKQERAEAAEIAASPFREPIQPAQPDVEQIKRNLSPQKDPNISNKKQTYQQMRAFSTSAPRTASKQFSTIHLQTQNPLEGRLDDSYDGPKIVKPILLSGEQENILQLAKQGLSLFYTGSAGTGKSVLLRAIIKTLREQHKGKVAVTASTGLAACNIGGITLHSFAGVGLGQGTVDNLLKKVRRNKKALTRWQTIKVLIVDEVSMIDGDFFNTLDELGRRIRRSNRPFGGIQLVVCGDFYQLPPVSKTTNIDGTDMTEKVEAKFAFESRAWEEAIECTLMLREVFRQKGDQQFIDMLNEMRTGVVSDEANRQFRMLARALPSQDGLEPAQLFSTRYEVENANNTRLNLLEGVPICYTGLDSGELPPDQRQTVLNNFLAPSKLFLKKGAQVMCIKNFDETLVNGSLGTVVGFLDRDTYMQYEKIKRNPEEEVETTKAKKEDKETKEDVKSDYIADPTHDSVFAFMDKMPEGSGTDDYSVAYQENMARKKRQLKELNKSSKGIKYPLVRFLLPDGVNTREVLVEPEVWTVEDENQKILAKRVQLPLILAWSLSIHKSQGQTLPKVKVDLRRVFENGQAYVALSRAVSRAGLQVLNFDRHKVKTHPKVTQFYERLLSAHEFSRRRGQQSLTFGRKVVGSEITI